jgi:endoglucanase
VVAAFGCKACIPEKEGATGANPAVASAADGKKCPPDGVIDDCEDNNNQVAANKGRAGYWYVFLDKVGSTVTPAAGGTFAMSKGGANGSAYAAHINGKVGTGSVVYAGVGFNFIDPKGPYDASAYKGISFWAKVGEGATKVRLKVPDGDTDPDGKVCTECFNDFGEDLNLTTTWTKYTLSFAQLSQLQGWGSPHPSGIDPKKLYGVQWQVNTPGSNYDLWIDEVEFTGCP